jgi:peroxiredoxin
VVFVGVAWTGDDGDFQDFIDRHGLTFPQISDDPGLVFQRFEVPGQPAFAIVAADGRVGTQLGSIDEASLDQILTDAIG